MTTVVAAVLTPILGGIVSYIIWQSKKSSDNVSKGLSDLHSCVHEVSRKVDDVQLDIAKNYCTRDELKDHIDKEEDWHDQHHQEVKELRKEFNEKTEKLTHDVAEMKDMQWMMRMEQLNKKNNL